MFILKHKTCLILVPLKLLISKYLYQCLSQKNPNFPIVVWNLVHKFNIDPYTFTQIIVSEPGK